MGLPLTVIATRRGLSGNLILSPMVSQSALANVLLPDEVRTGLGQSGYLTIDTTDHPLGDFVIVRVHSVVVCCLSGIGDNLPESPFNSSTWGIDTAH